MKKSLLIGLALVGILATSALAQAPADISYECPNGNVTFSHEKHIAKFADCTQCHPEPFGMAKSELGMEKGHAGCAKCHVDGGSAPMATTAADACVKCHVMPQ